MIDLRSDTVTKPTAEMLAFMFRAEVGDDVFSEDPSIIALEQKTASIFGKEAGIFCPSGTMTNQIGIKVLSDPPGEIICDELAHVYQYEGGGISFNSGLSVKLLQGDRGRLTANLVSEAINPNDVHKPKTQIVSVENTCNKGGGSIYPFRDLKEISELAKNNGLYYHLDGARIFNALTEADYTAKQVGSLFDTISVCMSKGLGCPVGSVLIGSNEHIAKARRIRKVFGGGMRQAGYLAAAAIYALDHHVNRLKEDHLRARKISDILNGLNYVEDIMPVETNIVVFKLTEKLDLNQFLGKLAEMGIKAVAFGPRLVRFVTHLDFSDDDLNELEKSLKNFRI
ncbi:MAG TPA: threonine aldolase [Flavobacteriales bacterium]|nr:threonine aldolase [Flavobacteriales bacterium]